MKPLLTHIWLDAGKPEPDRPVDQDGICALCGGEGSGCLTKAVVSDSFTDWDRLRWGDQSDMLCVACTWALRDRRMRHYPTLVDGWETVFSPPPSRIRSLLSKPVGGNSGLLLPISRKKHVTIGAGWARISTDNKTCEWDIEDVYDLKTYEKLRFFGFGEVALREKTPPTSVVRKKVNTGHVSEIFDLWDQLHEWRNTPWKMEIAARATRKDPET